MTTLPLGYREPTDEEMNCLPEGALYWDESTTTWKPSINISLSGYAILNYAVPITKAEIIAICDKGIADNTLPGTDPKQQHGEKKPQLHLIPKAALDEMARALELGKRKYGERNWITGDGVQITTYLSAMGRHLALLTDGTEDIDPESGAHHLGHLMAGCGIILDAMKHGKLIDNRVKP